MLSFVVAAVTCVFVALCYAELASMIPVAGSAYLYAYVTLGEFLAWTVGWILVLGYTVSAAAVAQGASHYFQELIGIFSVKLPASLTNAAFNYDQNSGRLKATGDILDLPALVIIMIATFILIIGITESARFNASMVIIKITVILMVIGVGAFYVNPSAWRPFAPYGMTGINFFGKTISGQENIAGQPLGMLAGAAIAFYAYIGFDSVSMYTEESCKPQRDVPLSIITSLAICTLLYIGIAAILTGMVPYYKIDSNAPISNAFMQVGQHWAQLLVAVGALTGIVSVVLVTMLTQARLLLAMARDGLIPPSIFAAIHERFCTPWKSTVVTGFFVALTTTLLPIGVLVGLVSIGILLVYLIVCVSVLVLRRTQPHIERPFRAPFVPVVPIFGVASCLLLMFSLPFDQWIRLFVWLLIGLAIYLIYGRRHSVSALRPSGQLQEQPPASNH